MKKLYTNKYYIDEATAKAFEAFIQEQLGAENQNVSEFRLYPAKDGSPIAQVEGVIETEPEATEGNA